MKGRTLVVKRRTSKSYSEASRKRRATIELMGNMAYRKHPKAAKVPKGYVTTGQLIEWLSKEHNLKRDLSDISFMIRSRKIKGVKKILLQREGKKAGRKMIWIIPEKALPILAEILKPKQRYWSRRKETRQPSIFSGEEQELSRLINQLAEANNALAGIDEATHPEEWKAAKERVDKTVRQKLKAEDEIYWGKFRKNARESQAGN